MTRPVTQCHSVQAKPNRLDRRRRRTAAAGPAGRRVVYNSHVTSNSRATHEATFDRRDGRCGRGAEPARPRAVSIQTGGSCTVSRVADLQPRSGRGAVFAAHADFAGQRGAARSGVGVSHAPGGAAHAAGRSRRCSTGGPGPRSWTRRIGLLGQRDHPAGRQRRDVHRRRRTAGSSRSNRRRAKKSGCSRCPPAIPRRVASSTGRATRRRRRRSSSARATARLYSLDAKTGAPNPAFGEQGSLNLNTPEILQGLPGSDGLSSPPTMFKQPHHHRRPDAGKSTAWSGRRRAGVGHPHRRTGVDIPIGAA